MCLKEVKDLIYSIITYKNDSFLFDVVIVFIGVYAVFLVDKHHKKRKWLKCYFRAVKKMLARTGGSYEKSIKDFNKSINAYCNKIDEMKKEKNKYDFLVNALKNIEIPRMNMTIDHEDVLRPVTSEAAIVLPTTLLDALLDYVRTYRKLEMHIQNHASHFSTRSAYLANSEIETSPERVLRWNEDYLFCLREVFNGLKRLAHDGDKVFAELKQHRLSK